MINLFVNVCLVRNESDVMLGFCPSFFKRLQTNQTAEEQVCVENSPSARTGGKMEQTPADIPLEGETTVEQPTP